MGRISASVGDKGANEPDDVTQVQKLLNRHASAVRYKVVKTDGKSEKDTIEAIKSFQRAMGMRSPDGRVDPNGKTLKALEARDSPKKEDDQPAKPAGASKPGKVSTSGCSLSGVQRYIVDYITEVAAFYGCDVVITSGKRDPKGQADAMFNNWVKNLERGQVYKLLQGNAGLRKQLDDLYNKAQGKGADAAAAEKEFKKTCTDLAPKLSRHLSGDAIDVRMSCMTSAMRKAMVIGGFFEKKEGNIYHYDNSRGSVAAVTDALKSKWPAP